MKKRIVEIVTSWVFLWAILFAIVTSGCVHWPNTSATSGVLHSSAGATGAGSVSGSLPVSNPSTATNYHAMIGKWLVAIWSICFVALLGGIALIIWTPFKLQGGITVAGSIVTPIVLTWIALHIALFILLVCVALVVWYFATHKLAVKAVESQLTNAESNFVQTLKETLKKL